MFVDIGTGFAKSQQRAIGSAEGSLIQGYDICTTCKLLMTSEML